MNLRIRVAAYYRVSPGKNSNEGTIVNQRDSARAYCVERDWELVEEYFEPHGDSQTLLDERPEAKRLLRDISAKQISLVLVWMFDRLGRGGWQEVNAYSILNLGIRLHSVIEGEYETQGDNPLINGIRAVLSGEEKRQIAIRLRHGMEKKVGRAIGSMGGRCPFGYRVEGAARKARWVPDETPIPGLDCGWSPADVIRRIWEWYLDARWTAVQIACELNRLGVPTAAQYRGYRRRKGYEDDPLTAPQMDTAGLWYHDRISKMIHNATYKGEYVYGDEDPAKREKRQRKRPGGRPTAPLVQKPVVFEVEPIIESRRWDLAHSLSAERRDQAPKNRRYDYMLSGMDMLWCGCGEPMIGQSDDQTAKGKKVYHRYDCSTKHLNRAARGTRHSCGSSAAPSDAVDAVIWSEIEVFLRDPDTFTREVLESEDTDQSRLGEVNQRLAQLHQDLGAVSLSRNKAIELASKVRPNGKPMMTEDQLASRLEQLDEEETRVSEEIACLEEQLQGIHLDAAEFAKARNLLEQMQRALQTGILPVEAKRTLVKALVKRVTLRTVRQENRRPYVVLEREYMLPIAESGIDLTQAYARTGGLDDPDILEFIEWAKHERVTRPAPVVVPSGDLAQDIAAAAHLVGGKLVGGSLSYGQP